MPDPIFVSARLKVKWANHYINEFEGWVDGFIKSEPYTLDIERNEAAHTTRIRIVGHELMPIGFPLVVGMAIQCLRSALDHAVSEIINAATGTDERSSFPFHKERETLKRSCRIGSIQGACPKLAEVILNEIDPTKDGNYPLWGLNRLANIDKHRALLIFDQINGFVGGGFSAPGMTMEGMRFRAPAGTHNDDSFFEVPLLDADGKIEPIVEIRIGETDAFKGAEVLPTITKCSHVVTETLNAMERAVR